MGNCSRRYFLQIAGAYAAIKAVEATFGPAVALANAFSREEYPKLVSETSENLSFPKPDYSNLTPDSKLKEIFPARSDFINSATGTKYTLPGMAIRMDDRKAPISGDYALCRIKTESGEEIKSLTELTFREFYSMFNEGKGIQTKEEDGAYGTEVKPEDDYFFFADASACIMKRLAGENHHAGEFGSLDAAITAFEYAYDSDNSPEEFLAKVKAGEEAKDLLDNYASQVSARTLDGTRPVILQYTKGDRVDVNRSKVEVITESFIPDEYRGMPKAEYVQKNKWSLTKIEDSADKLLFEFIDWLTQAYKDSDINHMMMNVYAKTNGKDLIAESFELGYLSKNRVERTTTVKEVRRGNFTTKYTDRMHGHRITFNKENDDHIYAYSGAIKSGGDQSSGDGNAGAAGADGGQSSQSSAPSTPAGAPAGEAQSDDSDNF